MPALCRTVLVTGGAKRLGAAIVRRVAADGHAVVVHQGHSPAEAAALVDEIVERTFDPDRHDRGS